MKKLSITTKITLWYAIFLMVMAVCFFGLIICVGEKQTEQNGKTELVEEVLEAQREIISKDNMIQFRRDFNSYDDGVYVAMFTMDGQMIEGKNPLIANKPPSFKEETITKFIDERETTWYIYDMKYNISGTDIWLRGHREDVAIANAYSIMIDMGLILLPLLLLFASVGGYLITRRSFLPFRKLADFANAVKRDGDFSRRIDVSAEIEESNDEILNLSANFNSMFDTVENLFEKEKQFTSDVSHELRTPLALIITQSDYALEEETYREEALGKIKVEAKRMADLVSKLLLLSRSDLGKVKLDLEPIDFSQLCQMVAEQQSILLDEDADIEVMTDIDEGMFILGDEATIIRVLLNITENAAKYGNNTKGEKSIIKISLKNIDGTATCTIEDNGDGIEANQLEQIWDKFYRVEKSRTKEGTGLGLSMAKALVNANKGEIYVASQVGSGTCFTITFDTIDK